MTLENWYWDALDWICERGQDMSVDRIISLSWEIASQYPDDPQEEFRIALANNIHGFTMVYRGIDDNLANDSWFSPEFENKCKYMLTSNFNSRTSNETADPKLRGIIKLNFNKAAYQYPRMNVAVKSQRSFFSPIVVSQ